MKTVAIFVRTGSVSDMGETHVEKRYLFFFFEKMILLTSHVSPASGT